MALTLAVGFVVVDDAIVVLENIVRHMEEGEKPYEASVRGAQEIGFTIVSMTISLVAAFIPVLFMSGMLGRLLREFAVTICVAILFPGLFHLASRRCCAAATCARRTTRSTDGSIMFLGRCLDLHESGLRSDSGVGDAAPRDYDGGVARRSVEATFHMFALVPKGFIPSEDTGQVADQHRRRSRSVLRPDGAQPATAGRYRRQEMRNVESFFSSVGVGVASVCPATRAGSSLNSKRGRSGQLFARHRHG